MMTYLAYLPQIMTVVSLIESSVSTPLTISSSKTPKLNTSDFIEKSLSTAYAGDM